MTTDQFAYWLQGYFEISGSSSLSDMQVQIIKDHLALVFNKVTPERKVVGLYGEPIIQYSLNPPFTETIVEHSC